MKPPSKAISGRRAEYSNDRTTWPYQRQVSHPGRLVIQRASEVYVAVGS